MYPPPQPHSNTFNTGISDQVDRAQRRCGCTPWRFLVDKDEAYIKIRRAPPKIDKVKGFHVCLNSDKAKLSTSYETLAAFPNACAQMFSFSEAALEVTNPIYGLFQFRLSLNPRNGCFSIQKREKTDSKLMARLG